MKKSTCVYAVIVFIIVYALYKERQALGCPTLPNGTDCDNANGKAIVGTKPHPSDSNAVLYEKINKGACFLDRVVSWRYSIIIGAVSTVLLTYFTHQRFPSPQEWAIGMFVIAGACYFTSSFYKYHLGDYIQHNIEDSVKILKSRTE